jgi:hypothetical protein
LTVAETLRKTPDYVRRLIRDEHLGARWRVKPEDLEAFLIEATTARATGRVSAASAIGAVQRRLAEPRGRTGSPCSREGVSSAAGRARAVAIAGCRPASRNACKSRGSTRQPRAPTRIAASACCRRIKRRTTSGVTLK